jgi:hypothetical protein
MQRGKRIFRTEFRRLIELFVLVSVNSSGWARHMTKLATDIPQAMRFSCESTPGFSCSTRWVCSVSQYRKIHILRTVTERSQKPFLQFQPAVLLFQTGNFLAFKQGLIFGCPKYVYYKILRIASFIRPGSSVNKPH